MTAKINLYKIPLFRYLLRKADKVVLPGLDGATLYQVGKFLVKQLTNARIMERTAAVTYNFIMALPPTFMFLFSLVPYLPIKNVQQTVLTTVKLITPNNKVYQGMATIIRDFMGKPHKDVLSFGILLVLFFSSNGMVGLMKTFDRTLVFYKRRTALQRRWMAVKLTIMLIVVGMCTLTVLFLQNKTVNKWVFSIYPDSMVVRTLSYTTLVAVMFVTFGLIYKYGPSLEHKFKFVNAGAIFATVSSLVATSVFFFLVNNFLNYNKVYGSIGTLIAFMVFVWLNTLIILLGFELNVSILLGKLSQEKHENQEG